MAAGALRLAVPAAPTSQPRRSEERALHIAAVHFLRRAMPEGVLFYHTPNGEHRDAKTAAKLKAFGTLAGVPDLTVLLPGRPANFIEFKAARGALSPAQKAFHAAAKAMGCEVAICRSLTDVEEIVGHWLAPYRLTLRARISA